MDLRVGNENSEKTKEGEGAFRIVFYIFLYYLYVTVSTRYSTF